jgi:hypothetical protein
LGFSSNQLASGTLGAHKQDVTATCCQLAQELLRFLILADSFFKVYNVNLVTGTEDVRSHLGVPVTGLVAKVHTGFKHFTHQGHGILQGLGLVPGLYCTAPANLYRPAAPRNTLINTFKQLFMVPGTRFSLRIKYVVQQHVFTEIHPTFTWAKFQESL